MITKFTIKIGKWEQEYTAMETTAPAECDGFGTFEIEDNAKYGKTPLERLVLVEVERKDWQRDQYRLKHKCQIVKRNVEPYCREMLRERVTKAGEGNLSVEKIKRKLKFKHLRLSELKSPGKDDQIIRDFINSFCAWMDAERAGTLVEEEWGKL